MMQIRAAKERGHSNYGWLDSHHTFSFADYHDPKHVHVSSLRVLNDDTVAPGAGFPAHGHRDMEIISVVLSGALIHEDSLGHRHTLRAGEIQRMTAGSGIVHSEFNASESEPVHFLQIWIFPDQKGLKPGYEIIPIAKLKSASTVGSDVESNAGSGFNKLVVPVKPGETPGESESQSETLQIHQDVTIYGAHLGPGQKFSQPLNPARTSYLHMATGAARVNGHMLKAGDGLRLQQETALLINTTMASQMLLFDLP